MRILLLGVLASWQAIFAQGFITSFAGTDWIFPASGKPAMQAPLSAVYQMAGDSRGNLYLSDPKSHMVHRMTPAGIIETVAGNGIEGYSGDGGDARNASLAEPTGLAFDRAGNLYIGDHRNSVIRRIDAQGIITTYAGSGVRGFAGDGGRAVQARISLPGAVTIAPDGALYFVDYGNARIRMVGTDGIIRTVAGNGTFGFTGDGARALQSAIAPGFGIAVDSERRVYFTEKDYRRVRVVGSDGILGTVAGNGQDVQAQEGATAATSGLTEPTGLILDSQGNLVVGSGPRVVRIVAGRYRIVAGDGEYEVRGDGGRAIDASLDSAYGVALDTRGNLHISGERCSCIRTVDANGIIRRTAGNGQFGRVADGTPAARSFILTPYGLAFNRAGDLLVANHDTVQLGSISSSGLFTILAGTETGCCTNGRPAKNAPLDSPTAIAVDSRNRIFLSESGINVVHVIENGVINVFAGKVFNRGFNGDGPATSTMLSRPYGLAVDVSGRLHIADSENRRVRRVNDDGTMITFAGDGQNRFAGDGNTPLSASFRRPYALAFAPRGELLIADIDDNRVRIVGADGLVRTFAGNGRAESTGDGGPAAQAAIHGPSALAVDSAGNVYIVEKYGQRVRRVDTASRITTIAGTGESGLNGDGGLSTAATFTAPELGLAINARGDLFIADTGNDRIRVISATPPRLSVDHESLAITVRAGEMSQPLSLTVQSDRLGVQFDAAATPAQWLQVSHRQAYAPFGLHVTVDARQLAPGTYQGSIQLNSTVAAPRSISVPVSVTVQATLPPQLGVPTKSLSFEVASGGVAEHTLTVTNTGGGTLQFTVSAGTVQGGDWLTASSEGTATPDAPASILVTASAAGLAPGTYSGILTIDSGTETVDVAVTLSVREQARPRILLSQVGLSFFGVANGGNPAPQTIGILNGGAGSMSWSATAVTLSGNDWLRLQQSSGQVSRPLLDVSLVEVSVDTRGLAAGDYYGRIEVTAPSENSPQYAIIVLHVLPAGSNPGPEVRPSALIFTGSAGASPGSQTVSISNLVSNNIQFASSRLTFDGDLWFTHAPGNGEVVPNAPAKIIVQPDYQILTPGVRRGVLTLLFDDGTSRNVNLLTVVASADTSKSAAERRIAGCPSNLRMEFTSLREGFSAIVGQPSTMEVRIVDECGNLLTPQNTPGAAVLAEFSNRDPSTKMVHIGNGTWTGTWKPLTQGPVVVSVLVFYVENGNIKAAGAQRSGNVQIVGRTPLVTAGSLRHSATFETGIPVTPGQLISVLGGNLADAALEANGLPLPLEVGDTAVLLGGRPLPLLFASDLQINAQVPYDLPVNTTHQIVVRRGQTLSVPEDFVVAPAQPGVFTKNERGYGQGAVLKLDGRTYAEPGTPAEKGEELIILCTGLGAVNPPVSSGQPGPDPPARVMQAVSVTIGGVPAEVKSAILSPGLAGRYEIRVVVPAGAASGDAVPVIVTAAGRSSPAVQMAVK